jgi:chloramphenicol-sensitive protein RarD
MEISLGYYINPLVNVVLGVLVLRERLSPAQGVAVALAAIGVANLAFQTTGVPWPSLVVALSFGFYGLIRKTTNVESIEGLFVETLMMGPFALVFLMWLGAGTGSFTAAGPGQAVLLMAAGLITSLPLIWFTSGARRISYIAVGFFQYLAPTGHFLLAVFAFGEPFSIDHAITFAFIWTALAIFSADRWRQATRDRRARRAAAAQ